MSEDESNEWQSLFGAKYFGHTNEGWKDFVYNNAESTAWLLSKNFDLFNLIESSLALPITKQ
jgi:hypothetical protein